MKEGVGIQSLMTLTVGLNPLAIFVASFFNKKSEWKLTRFDLVCGLLSFLGFVVYLVTQVGVIALVFSIVADGLASLPTIKKSFYFPESESIALYLSSSISAVLTLLTLKNWSFMNSAFPIYIFAVCVIITIFTHFKIGKAYAKES